MDNILIIGSSGHARVVIDIVRQEGRYNIAGLIDKYREAGELTFGYPILGSEKQLPDLIEMHSIIGVIIAIGDNDSRSNVAEEVRLLCPDLPFISAIHPSAAIAADVSIGEGSVVMAGVCINSAVSIGRGCILNTHSSIDHDGTMNDFSSLAPGVHMGGNCTIGETSAIGIGAVIIHGIEIGEHCVIGAGSLVLDAIEPNVVAYGSPAKVIRTRKPGDKYL